MRIDDDRGDGTHTSHKHRTDGGKVPLSKGASIVVFPGRKVLRLSKRGRSGDPTGMLDAVLTSNVSKGENVTTQALLLNPKGRILSDLVVVKDAEDLLLVAEAEGARIAEGELGRYAPFSRVAIKVTDLSAIGIFGPEAGNVIPESPREGSSAKIEIGGHGVIVYSVGSEPDGFVILTDEQNVAEVVGTLEDLGAIPAEEPAYETSRIFRRIPRFGHDITQENFPAEARLEESAVDFDKGCYPGQETVARMHYRGQPSKRIHRFIVGGEAAAGSSIVQGDRDVGRLTSIAPLPVEGKTYALGYLKRKADVEGELLAGTATLEVSVPEEK